MDSKHLHSRTTASYFVRLMVKHPSMDDEARRICKEFLISCENWDLKIQYSRHLTRIEVAKSIFNTISSRPQRQTMRWPTRAYTDKYERRNKQKTRVVQKKLPNISSQEAENDDLFQTAANLGEDFLIRNAKSPTELLHVLEVYRVFVV